MIKLKKTSLFTFLSLVAIVFGFFNLFVNSVHAQSEASLCTSVVAEGEAALTRCLKTNFGESVNIYNACNPEICECDKWSEASASEMINVYGGCEPYYQCGFYADSGDLHFAACLPVKSEVAEEEIKNPCSLQVDASNTQYLVINNHSLPSPPPEGYEYRVRYSGIEDNGLTTVIQSSRVSIRGSETITQVKIPVNVAGDYSRIHFELLQSPRFGGGQETLCQTSADSILINNLEKTTTEEELRDAADLHGSLFDYCKQTPGSLDDDTSERYACYHCVRQGDEGDFIYTAVGCVQVNGKGFAGDLIKIVLGVAGVASLLSILAAAFILTTSRGESGKVKQAKELITASISGLLLIIFSIIIMEYIGVQILHIPGLG